MKLGSSNPTNNTRRTTTGLTTQLKSQDVDMLPASDQHVSHTHTDPPASGHAAASAAGTGIIPPRSPMAVINSTNKPLSKAPMTAQANNSTPTPSSTTPAAVMPTANGNTTTAIQGLYRPPSSSSSHSNISTHTMATAAPTRLASAAGMNPAATPYKHQTLESLEVAMLAKADAAGIEEMRTRLVEMVRKRSDLDQAILSEISVVAGEAQKLRHYKDVQAALSSQLEEKRERVEALEQEVASLKLRINEQEALLATRQGVLKQAEEDAGEARKAREKAQKEAEGHRAAAEEAQSQVVGLKRDMDLMHADYNNMASQHMQAVNEASHWRKEFDRMAALYEGLRNYNQILERQQQPGANATSSLLPLPPGEHGMGMPPGSTPGSQPPPPNMLPPPPGPFPGGHPPFPSHLEPGLQLTGPPGPPGPMGGALGPNTAGPGPSKGAPPGFGPPMFAPNTSQGGPGQEPGGPPGPSDNVHNPRGNFFNLPPPHLGPHPGQRPPGMPPMLPHGPGPRMLHPEELVGLLLSLLPDSPEAALMPALLQEERLAGPLYPLTWNHDYKPWLGNVADFMRSRRDVFIERPDGAFFRRLHPGPMGPPPPGFGFPGMPGGPLPPAAQGPPPQPLQQPPPSAPPAPQQQPTQQQQQQHQAKADPHALSSADHVVVPVSHNQANMPWGMPLPGAPPLHLPPGGSFALGAEARAPGSPLPNNQSSGSSGGGAASAAAPSHQQQQQQQSRPPHMLREVVVTPMPGDMSAGQGAGAPTAQQAGPPPRPAGTGGRGKNAQAAASKAAPVPAAEAAGAPAAAVSSSAAASAGGASQPATGRGSRTGAQARQQQGQPRLQQGEPRQQQGAAAAQGREQDKAEGMPQRERTRRRSKGTAA
mmetsp:Transcript_18503/g.39739  ORF Transcript_18503/g.39739 Transcript_18503/m.39739 type:complete len:877 (+) Transcript_18503:332-2962(+)